MLKIESWPPTVENTSLSEEGIFMINEARIRNFHYNPKQVAKDCGTFLAANTDTDTAREIVGLLAQDERLSQTERLPFLSIAMSGIKLHEDLARRSGSVA
jgi:hypothetical protein